MNITYAIYGWSIFLFILGLGMIDEKQWKTRLRRIKPADVKEAYRCRKQKVNLWYGGLNVIKKKRQAIIDKEIYEGLSFLRNITGIHKENVSCDYIISQLAEREGLLKSAYIGMLSLLRTNRIQEAEKFFKEFTACESGKEFGGLLLSWDQLSPAKLLEILISQQMSIKEMCITRQKKRDETISDIIYFPVVINVFIIFINFIYVSYFMEQKEMFQLLF